MPNFKDRLQRFLNHEDISMRTFERQCDIKAGTASKMTEKSYAITFHKIQQGYPQLNVEWLKTGKGEMLKTTAEHPVHIRQDHNNNSALFGYVNIAVPEKEKKKILNSDGIVIEGDDEGDYTATEQLEHYKTIIAAKDEQISRLMAMVEEKGKTISKLLDKI